MKQVILTVICLVHWCTLARGVCVNGAIRLRGGCSETEGRVEICNDNTWGTVCDDRWGENDAKVVCRQLGFSTADAEAWYDAYFGSGSGPILLDNVQCSGNEGSLVECDHIGIGVHNCEHHEDAGVICQPAECEDNDIRLQGGDSLIEGRVEICKDNSWKTICDNNWTTNDATVACRQLGFSDTGAIPEPYYAQHTQSHNKRFTCNGDESKLADCQRNTINCTNMHSVGVICQVSPENLQLAPQANEITLTWNTTTSKEGLYYEAFCDASSTNYKYSFQVEASQLRDNIRVTYYELQPQTEYQCCITAYCNNKNILAIPTTCKQTETLTTTTGSTQTTVAADDHTPTSEALREDCSAVGAGLGVVLAVLLLLLALTTGGCVYLLLTRKKHINNYTTATTTMGNNGCLSETPTAEVLKRNPAYGHHHFPICNPNQAYNPYQCPTCHPNPAYSPHQFPQSHPPEPEQGRE